MFLNDEMNLNSQMVKTFALKCHRLKNRYFVIEMILSNCRNFIRNCSFAII